MEKEIEEYLKEQNCRGCYNRCQLSNPMCGRSRIFIKDAIEKFNAKKEQ